MGFYLAPLMSRMHEMGAKLPHEELQLSAVSFRSFLVEPLCRVPSYQSWYASQDHGEAYLEPRRLLQLLQSDGGAEPRVHLHFASGETVYRKRTGSGLGYNNWAGALFLHPDGEVAYSTTIFGLVRVSSSAADRR